MSDCFRSVGGYLPLAYKSEISNSQIAQQLQQYQKGMLTLEILVSRCIPPLDFFKARVAETFEDILEQGVIVDAKCKTKYAKTCEGEWGRKFNVNPEGYDKMMMPDTVMQRLKSNPDDERVYAGYIPTTFKIKPEYKVDESAARKELGATFTVWRFHLLSPDIVKRCALLEKNSIGKELRLKSSDFPGPSFLVALPIASADASADPGPDGGDGTARIGPAAGSRRPGPAVPPARPTDPPLRARPLKARFACRAFSGRDGRTSGERGAFKPRPASRTPTSDWRCSHSRRRRRCRRGPDPVEVHRGGRGRQPD